MKMRLVDGFVVDLSQDPDSQFHLTIADQFVDVPKGAPADLKPGYAYDGKRWTAPAAPAAPVAPPPPEPVYRTLVTRVEYYGLFYPDEEAMIRIVAAELVTLTDLKTADAAEKARLMAVASLAVMIRRTDALAPTGTIDLADHQVEAGLDLLVAMELLRSPDRAPEIRRGVPDTSPSG